VTSGANISKPFRGIISHLQQKMILAIDYLHFVTQKTIFAPFLSGTFGALWRLHLIFWGKVPMVTFVLHKKCYKMALIKLQITGHQISYQNVRSPLDFCRVRKNNGIFKNILKQINVFLYFNDRKNSTRLKNPKYDVE